ncbi:isochorismatase-like protein [Fragilaria crotonensis]|nr:isochorismatase-like protein [Fragilaria crotonensis]
MQNFVDADPYQWPYNGNLHRSNTCLVVIDMQVDFCSRADTQTPWDTTLNFFASLSNLFDGFWTACGAKVITSYSLEGHRPDLSDLNENKRWRTSRGGAEIGSPGPCGRFLVRGEPGWDIILSLHLGLGTHCGQTRTRELRSHRFGFVAPI